MHSLIGYRLIMAAMAMLQVIRCNVTRKLSCHALIWPVSLFSSSEYSLVSGHNATDKTPLYGMPLIFVFWGSLKPFFSQ